MKSIPIIHINNTNKYTHITMNNHQNIIFSISVKNNIKNNLSYFNINQLNNNIKLILIEYCKQIGIREVYIKKNKSLFK